MRSLGGRGEIEKRPFGDVKIGKSFFAELLETRQICRVFCRVAFFECWRRDYGAHVQHLGGLRLGGSKRRFCRLIERLSPPCRKLATRALMFGFRTSLPLLPRGLRVDQRRRSGARRWTTRYRRDHVRWGFFFLAHRHRLAGAISQILVDALIGEGWEIPAFSHTPGGFASLPALRSSSMTSQSGFRCRPPTVRAAGARRDDSRGARLQERDRRPCPTGPRDDGRVYDARMILDASLRALGSGGRRRRMHPSPSIPR